MTKKLSFSIAAIYINDSIADNTALTLTGAHRSERAWTGKTHTAKPK